MAHIRRRGNSFLIMISNGRDANKKQKMITETYHPKATTPKKIEKEVEDYARRLEQKVRDGEYYSGEKMTFNDCVKVWEEDYAADNLTQTTKENYIRVLNSVGQQIGNLYIGKIKAPQIRAIYKDMKDQGKMASTIQKTHVIINSVFKFAYMNDIIQSNPCDKCEIPKVENKTYQDIHFFTPDQAKTFLDAVGKDFESQRKGCTKVIKGKEYSSATYTQTIKPSQPKMWKAYFYLAIFGGFRRGEIVALNWNQIDFANRKVTISQSVARTKAEGQIVKDPKTRSSRRTLDLPKDCFTVLNEWRLEQMKIDFRMGTAWNDFKSLPEGERPVFTQLENGRRMDVATPSHKFKEILDRYNETAEEGKELPRIRLHDLRHTSATLLLANNMDIETVSHRLGHSKASVTLDVYGHWTEENDLKASETLARLLG